MIEELYSSIFYWVREEDVVEIRYQATTDEDTTD
jgi:hypothetical protein